MNASSYHPVAEVFALLKGFEQGLGVCDYSEVEVFRCLQKKLSSSDYNPQWAANKMYIRSSWAVSVKKNLIDVLQGVFIHAVVYQVDRLVLCLFTFFEDLKHLASKSFSFVHYFSLVLSLRKRNVFNSGRTHLLAGIFLLCDHPRSCRCRALYLFDRLYKQLRIQVFLCFFVFFFCREYCVTQLN